MVCRSGSVSRAADNSEAARRKIAEIQANMEQEQKTKQEEFKTKIKESLANGNIDDAIEKSSDYRVLVEYSKEFSLELIAQAVLAGLDVLKTLSAPSDPPGPSPATSPEAITSYKGLVTSVVAAAKSSSKVSSSLSFSKTRIAPGIYVFLYAFSSSITDKDTFGTEAITASCVMYSYYVSIKDVQLDGAFLVAQNNLTILALAKQNEVANAQDLAASLKAAGSDKAAKLTAIATYNAVNEALKSITADAQSALDKSGWKPPAPSVRPLLAAVAPSELEIEARSALKDLIGVETIYSEFSAKIEARYFSVGAQ